MQSLIPIEWSTTHLRPQWLFRLTSSNVHPKTFGNVEMKYCCVLTGDIPIAN
jgi:hypothetical protein